jgi:hypothetical protein
VRPDVSSAQAIKTLIHELGHALLHSEGPVTDREVAEVEVESVAFVVCNAIGVDAGDYSPYVTRWAEGSAELVKKTAERAIACAKKKTHLIGRSKRGKSPQPQGRRGRGP